MTKTTNLSISLVEQNQAQKEVTVNEAISKIDAVINRGAISNNVDTPPDTPESGDIYIVGNNPTGSWASYNNNIAYFQGVWKFIKPNEGICLWVNDEDQIYVFNGTEWRSLINARRDNDDDITLEDFSFTSLEKNDLIQYNGTAFVNKTGVSNISNCSINTDLDQNNRFSVRANSSLFSAETNDIRVNINKQTEEDTASLTFSSEFSSTAELGLVANNDFQIKVSQDGENFYPSLVIDRNNGNAHFKQDLIIEGMLLNATLKNYSESFIVHNNSGNSIVLDIESGNTQEIILTDNCTISFPSNLNEGKAVSLNLILKQDAVGGRIVTWPPEMKWENNLFPVLSTSANDVHILTFLTTDAGSIWYGFTKGLNMS